MHVTYIKRTERPFTLKGIEANSDEERWNGLFAQLKSFGVELDGKKQDKLIKGDNKQMNGLISELFEIDNNPTVNIKDPLIHQSNETESISAMLEQSTDVASRFS